MKANRKRQIHPPYPETRIASGKNNASANRYWLFALLVLLFLLYLPVIPSGLLWDDKAFIFENPLIVARNGLWKIWFSGEVEDYTPLSLSTFWLEWRIWGNHYWPYHMVNILLHGCSALVLWRVLRQLYPRAAYLGALIFAVHPMAVSSVAWIFERRNTLSLLLALLSLLAFLHFCQKGSRKAYVFSLIVFMAALLAKASVVTLPCVLLLILWWRNRRVQWRDLLSLAPFFILSLAIGLVTIHFQQHTATGELTVHHESWPMRIATAGRVLWFYICKDVVPIRQTMIYPRIAIDPRHITAYLPTAAWVLLLGGFWINRRREWCRHAFTALAAYTLLLLPVLGFISIAFSQYSQVADHLQYIGLPVFAFALAALVLAIVPAQTQRIVAVAVVLCLSELTLHLAIVYRNAESLFRQNTQLVPQSWGAWNALGLALVDQLRYEEALQCLNQTADLQPGFADVYINRGKIHYILGDPQSALNDYARYLQLHRPTAEALNNRALSYQNLGRLNEAIADLQRAIRLSPDYSNSYMNLAVVLALQGQYDKAKASALEYQRHGGRVAPEFMNELNARLNTGRHD